jgi:hypothetical protein
MNPARRLILSVFATTLGALAFTAAPALAAAPETPETGKASAITATTATLEGGVLNPHATGEVGEYEYRFRVSETECEGESSTAPEAAAGKEKEAIPPVDLTNLQPNAHYTFCLVEHNLGGEYSLPSTPAHFTTKAAPPTIAAPPSTSITPTEAHLEGLVNPNNQSTECHVQYGTDASLATKTTAECEPEMLEGYGDQGSLTLSGLTQATTYYYRVIAKNATGQEAGAIEHFTTGTPEPPETGDATSIEATEATLHGVLNPKHAGEAGSYEFVYRQSASECQGGEEKRAPEPAEGALGAKGEAKEVSITGLLPGMPYTFCLLAKNAAEEAALGKPVTFTTLAAAPTVTSESVSAVEATAATLGAEINPEGAATTYHFEYLTEAQFNANGDTFAGATTTPESKSIGADDIAHSATTRITGLTPGTTYHYLVVATNVESPTGGTPGPDKTLTTNAAPSTVAETCPNEQLRADQPYGLTLPDCRAYEMVSPADTNGNDAVSPHAESATRASEAPEGTEPAITYPAKGSYAEPGGALVEDQYVSRRTPTGWSTQATTPLSSTGKNGATEEIEGSYPTAYFTPELTAGLALTSATLGEAPPLGEQYGVYVAQFADHSYRFVRAGGSNPPWGASENLQRVLLTKPENNSLFEWINGTDVPVSVNNKREELAAAAGSAAPAEGAPGFAKVKDAWHATSEDGSRVFFTTPPNLEEGAGQLFVRVNIGEEQSKLNGEEECIETEMACTIEVSASKREPEDPQGLKAARYWGASADGGKVFFTSDSELIDDAYTGAEDNAANLYEYDVETGVLKDLTGKEADASGEGAAVQGVTQISEDGSYVYFVANGVLTNAANARGEYAKQGNCSSESQVGNCSLYVSHEGGPPVFIATLIGKDKTDWLGNSSEEAGPEVNTAVVTPNASRLATPNGSRLAFISEARLTGYDNEQTQAGQCQTRPGHGAGKESGACREVFMYDTETRGLVCASCDPTGAPPVGPSALPDGIGGFADYRPRAFLADGSLFFESGDQLVAHASSARKNVYEYEGGAVHAISNVAGGFESFFLDASPNGENVFFASANKLLPEDPGGNTVVWDAREGGGFPVVTLPPSCDNADSCKPPESPQPGVFAPPASSTFSGPGNPAPSSPAVVKPAVKPKMLTRAQKLAKALKVCAKDKQKSKRAKCQKQAKQKYGASKAKKSAHTDRRPSR